MRRALLLSVLLVGCGAPGSAAPAPPRPPASARVQLEGGITVGVPAGWSLATRLTALAGPAERFTLSSVPISEGSQDNCGPHRAVGRLPADTVLAFVVEYRPRDKKLGSPVRFPPRARALRVPLPPPARLECLGEGSAVGFEAGRRAFQADLAIGARAPRARVERLLEALRHLHVTARET